MTVLHVLRCDCCGAMTEAGRPDAPRWALGWLHRWETVSLSASSQASVMRDYCPACGESCACTGRCVRPDRRAT